MIKYSHFLNLDVPFIIAPSDPKKLEESFKTSFEKIQTIESVGSVEMYFEVTSSLVHKFEGVKVEYTSDRDFTAEESKSMVAYVLDELFRTEVPLFDYFVESLQTVTFDKDVSEWSDTDLSRLVLTESSWVEFKFKVMALKSYVNKTEINDEFSKIMEKVCKVAYEMHHTVVTSYTLPTFYLSNVKVNSLVKGIEYDIEFMVRFEPLAEELLISAKSVPESGIDMYYILSDSNFKPMESGFVLRVADADYPNRVDVSKRISKTTSGWLNYTIVLKSGLSYKEVRKYSEDMYQEFVNMVKSKSNGKWVLSLDELVIVNKKEKYEKGDEIQIKYHIKFVKADPSAEDLVLSTREFPGISGVVVPLIWLSVAVVVYLIFGKVVDFVKSVEFVFDSPTWQMTGLAAVIFVGLGVLIWFLWKVISS